MIDGKSSLNVNDMKSNVSFKKVTDIIARTIDEKKSIERVICGSSTLRWYLFLERLSRRKDVVTGAFI